MCVCVCVFPRRLCGAPSLFVPLFVVSSRPIERGWERKKRKPKLSSARPGVAMVTHGWDRRRVGKSLSQVGNGRTHLFAFALAFVFCIRRDVSSDHRSSKELFFNVIRRKNKKKNSLLHMPRAEIRREMPYIKTVSYIFPALGSAPRRHSLRSPPFKMFY